MKRRGATLLASMAFLLVACVGLGEPSASPRRTAIDDDLTRLLTAVAGGGTAGSQGELDQLWEPIIADTSMPGLEVYEPPNRVIPYFNGEVPDSACAQGTEADQWAQNAFYCSADQSVLYDEDWLRDFASKAGEAAPTAIIAHEWGHHIQRLLGETGFSIQTELQADCFAGLYLANTEETEAGVPASDAALQEMLEALFEIGDRDYSASKWFQAGAHGSSQQRIRAFGTGYTSSYKTAEFPPPLGRGLAVCFGYGEFLPLDVSQIGPYRLLNLPGRTESTEGDVLRVAPEMRLGFETSSVAIDWLEGSDVFVEFSDHFPGLQTTEPQIDVTENVKPSTGSANHFEQVDASLPNGVRSGMVGLIGPQNADGVLAVLVYRDATTPTELDEPAARTLMEQMALLYELFARLCGPDDSGEIGAENLKLTCLDDQ